VTSKQAHLIYEFGEFRLDALRRVLSRDDGSPLQVTGKIFDTLLVFVERAGQLLDKRTLMETLWPNVVVEESNLTQTVHTLRRLLGERPDDHRYIVTVPGRGYRFVAQVTTRICEEPQPAPRPRSFSPVWRSGFCRDHGMPSTAQPTSPRSCRSL
jgi:DNA-binding winged helix-turn-helix (wHTH) protein